MPFTPFHLGPALAIGLPLRKRIHAPTFVIANVILDIEPFLVIVLNLRYPLHGYLHTFIGALVVGLLLGYTMYVMEGASRLLWRRLLLVPTDDFDLRAFLVAGASGTMLHVLLDSPLYRDIKPLYPLLINPMYNPKLTRLIYEACTLMAIAGLACYLGVILRKAT